MTRLSSRLPAGEANGIGARGHELAAHPGRTRLLVAEVDVSSVTTDLATGEVRPTVVMRRVELLDGQAAMDAALMLRNATDARTGRTALPGLDGENT